MVESKDAAMLQNAIAALEMGVEDVKAPDPRRAASAVRHLHAGVLLLLKEVLFRLSPELISTRLVPKLQGGRVSWVAKGNKTVDREEIKQRWKSLGLRDVEWSRLDRLAQHRNEVEHKAPSVSHEALQETVANTFVLVDEVLRHHLDESPAHLLEEETWSYMSSEAGLHEKLSDECRLSRQALVRSSSGILQDTLAGQLECPDCGSVLLRFADETDYPDTQADCVACGQEWTVGQLVEEWARAEAEAEAYANKGMGETSWGPCPNCDSHAYSMEEDVCLLCEETKPHDRCLRCDNSLTLDEQPLGGLCGYCNHMMDD